ncbi:bifunctional hydroxymethylpyrimidine kinase/phosphomethylpyrimidine kinase [Arcobacter sp. FWKO B]|uniref:bifunctional hydroxymethylpyrimidine kinase/phosphomethylpyrimidine kinase n=1 Tax=Arcobacter sp. FWKO B TaxID=2593672 RepID=UPI0018A5853C|nr:bifunctional hydroxymethylpyrimidine kinase/phosphomethylpyrimidine kinase [Arcobacter sp. FWKO B]QOG11331.1 bifunctional hydroxymethylpyrimidine kinase/phosphomethylpyrimidine kinase [Arcobacter sp. FWKO B]
MKVILSIAGSDSGGCAGIQADIKTAEYFGCFSTTCVTVLTAQNTVGVKNINPIDTNFIKNQLDAIFEDYEVSAIKTGMLYNKEIISVVYDILKDKDIPLVIDPVCVSRSGDKLLLDDAIDEYFKLFSIASVVTPNFYESLLLLKCNDSSTNEIYNKASLFVENYKTNILIKQLPRSNTNSIDTLFGDNFVEEYSSVFVNSKNTNGTGCSFSTAIACNLANGLSLQNSISSAKDFIYKTILKAPNLGHGNGPVMHNIRSILC